MYRGDATLSAVDKTVKSKSVDLTHVCQNNQWLVSSASGWFTHSQFFHTSSIKALVTTKITSEKLQHNSRYNTELGGRKKAKKKVNNKHVSTYLHLSHPTTSGHWELSDFQAKALRQYALHGQCGLNWGEKMYEITNTCLIHCYKDSLTRTRFRANLYCTDTSVHQSVIGGRR